jgi:hypothetical protein
VERDVNFLPTSSPKAFKNFQFDSAGSIYYVGSPDRNRIGTANYFPGWYQSTDLVIRRVGKGAKLDFGVGTNPSIAFESNRINQGIQNFYVMPNGSIIVDQERGWVRTPCPTSDTQSSACHDGAGYVLDVYSPNGEKIAVSNCSLVCNVNGSLSSERPNAVTLLNRMADGRILVGYGGCLCIVDPTTWRFSDKAWYSSSLGSSEFFSPSECSSGVNLPVYTRRYVSFFCNWGANKWRYSWTTPDSRTFAVVGSTNECFLDACPIPLTESYLKVCCWTGILAQIFPTFEPTVLGGNSSNRILENIESYVAVLSQFVASGSTANGSFKTVMYDTNSKTIRELIPEVEGIRVDEMVFSASTNSVVFVGTKLDQNQRVSGVIDLVRNSYRFAVLQGGRLSGLVSVDR